MKTTIVKAGMYAEAEITTDRTGRMSVVISSGSHKIVEVELPCRTGEFKNSFIPSVKIDRTEVDIEDLKP